METSLTNKFKSNWWRCSNSSSIDEIGYVKFIIKISDTYTYSQEKINKLYKLTNNTKRNPYYKIIFRRSNFFDTTRTNFTKNDTFRLHVSKILWSQTSLNFNAGNRNFLRGQAICSLYAQRVSRLFNVHMLISVPDRIILLWIQYSLLHSSLCSIPWICFK